MCARVHMYSDTHTEEDHMNITHAYLVVAEGWSQGNYVTSHAAAVCMGEMKISMNKRWFHQELAYMT